MQRGIEIHCYLCPFYLLKWHWNDQNRASLETILFSTLLLGNCHLGLRTRSRFRTLILNNPKFYHCCTSWLLPEVSFFFTDEVFWFSPAPSFADDPDKTKPTPKTLGGAKADEEDVRKHQNRGSCRNLCKYENIQMLKRVGGNSHLQFSECVVTAIGFCLARWRVIIGFHAFQLKHQVTSWIYSTIALRHLVHRMHWISPSLHGLWLIKSHALFWKRDHIGHIPLSKFTITE